MKMCLFSPMIPRRLLLLLIILALLLNGCLAELPEETPSSATPTPEPTPTLPLPTPMATRPIFQPGELVDYTAQSGDTLVALAARFNTSVEEIRQANPIIPEVTTTMPPGMPMKIPIYYLPLWGSSYQIIPDSLFTNGPAQRDFDPVAFVDQQPGWLKNYVSFAGGQNRRGGAIIAFVATNYSVSPRLLLAIIEYQTGALSNPEQPTMTNPYPLGKNDFRREGIYRQAAWAADLLNQGYYNWRTGKLLSFEHLDRRLERPDPWQNAATVALQHYYSRIFTGDDYVRAVSSVGLAETYRNLFGDPWLNTEVFIPGSLEQPAMQLPFERGKAWSFTGGPHNAWGDETMPLAALDFAPPALASGCLPSKEWSTAVADGVIARTDFASAVLDLDGDGDERTGWAVFYLHLEPGTIPPVGKRLKAGDPIGRPSCEGGRATGTHVHIARKFNGEWMLAEGALAFNLEGWVAYNGSAPYLGTLKRFGETIFACVCSNKESQVYASGPVVRP
jgi:LasA protease